MPGSDSAQINYRLREERTKHNLSQEMLADKLGITALTVNRWERGTQQPRAYFRIKLCELFGKSAEELGLLPEVSFAQPPQEVPSSDEDPPQPPEASDTIASPPDAEDYTVSPITIPTPLPQPLPFRAEDQTYQNRARMLARLRHTYRELSEHSLQGAVKLELGLAELPDAVQNAANLLLQVSEQTTRLQLPKISLLQAYEKSEYELLILGAPGSGKSMLLLELAQQLVLRAQQEDTHPLPVLLPLSSWAQNHPPLDAWLVTQLGQIYHVPVRLAKRWIQTERILPLLDGLDEMDDKARPACIAAINAYHRTYLAPLVVCSRYAEYEAAAKRERLHLLGALLVQPLSQEQVESYLHSVDAQVPGLHMALHNDADLQELVKTPLMLNILSLAYQGTSLHEITSLETLPAKQQRVFATYVQRMLARQGKRAHSTPEQTVYWLTYLARQMREHNQTIFYLEHLQPDWLAPSERSIYTWSGVLLPGILLGILVSLSLFLFVDTILQEAIDLSAFHLIALGMLGGLLGGLFSQATLGHPPRSRQQAPRQDHSSSIQREPSLLRFIPTMHPRLLLLAVAGVALGVGLGIGLSGGDLGVGLSVALSAGLSSVFLSLLLSLQIQGIQLTERLRWTWGSLIRSLFAPQHWTMTLVLTSFLTLLPILGYWWLDIQMFHDSLTQGLGVGLGIGLSASLGIGLSYWLLLGLLQGISSEQLEEQLRQVPGQGIRASLHRSLLIGVISWGVFWLISTLSYGVSTWLNWVPGDGLIGGFHDWLVNYGPNVLLVWTLRFGWVLGLCGGLGVALVNGGLAAWRHGILRLLLQRSGRWPRHCARFFNSAASAILLQKVGGGYSFIHRLLLDYFAERERNP